jgi:hypothetical protein
VGVYSSDVLADSEPDDSVSEDIDKRSELESTVVVSLVPESGKSWEDALEVLSLSVIPAMSTVELDSVDDSKVGDPKYVSANELL